MTWNVSLNEIADFYDSKTQALLHRYGPGPRVHYHAGLFDEPEEPHTSPEVLKKQIVASQERILEHAAQTWRASSTLSGNVLDAGCGLGGGSIFWAQNFGACVTAVTLAPSHISHIKRFAAEAGVASQIQPLVHNVTEMPGENCFDAAVAFESSCHMPRPALFQRLATLLRPKGRVFIADFFFEQPQYGEVWHQHWYAPLGTINEYRIAAQQAGFQEESVEEVSHRSAQFWAMTAALIQIEAQQKENTPSAVKKVEKSLQAHLSTYEGLMNGGLRHLFMSFVKNN